MGCRDTGASDVVLKPCGKTLACEATFCVSLHKMAALYLSEWSLSAEVGQIAPKKIWHLVLTLHEALNKRKAEKEGKDTSVHVYKL